MKKTVLSLIFTVATLAALWFLFTPQPDQAPASAEAVVSSEPATLSLQQGVHYQTFAAPESEEKGALKEVYEFFSYGCMHCRTFAPLLSDWANQHGDLRLEYVPVIWSEETELFAKVFYAMQGRNDFKLFHQGFFDFVATLPRTASLEEKQASIIRYLNEQGVEPITLLDALGSAEVADQVARAVFLARHYEVDSTPTLVISQQHKILNSGMSSLEALLVAAEALLTVPGQQER